MAVSLFGQQCHPGGGQGCYNWRAECLLLVKCWVLAGEGLRVSRGTCAAATTTSRTTRCTPPPPLNLLQVKWYLERDLAELVSEDPVTVIRLKFTPRGRCVVAGAVGPGDKCSQSIATHACCCDCGGLPANGYAVAVCVAVALQGNG